MLQMPEVTPELLARLSGMSTTVIVGACAAHLFAFFVLWVWSGRDLRRIVGSLDEFTRGLKHRSVLSKGGHYSDQIEAFLADVNEVLSDDTRGADRHECLLRMNILDERRGYLDSMSFATSYNMCRTMIEAYPLAGVLGTILAIGTALQADKAVDATATLSGIVSSFGDAIWSTFAGLTAAILLMFLNSWLETGFHRLNTNRDHVRDMIARAKRELALQVSGDDS
jgi:biopolymer transport protein ExbB/TolQ